MKSQNEQTHCQISSKRMCKPCSYTMKMSSRYHWLLTYDLKRTTKIDSMGPFNRPLGIKLLAFELKLVYIV